MSRFVDWEFLEPAARERASSEAESRARRLEPILNAFVSIGSPARAAHEGPLAHLPYAAKDVFAVPGRHPSGGLGVDADFGLLGEAAVLRHLDAAGAIRIGFTTMTELAYEPSGHNSVRGRTRNPWNLDFISGGSSSGSAAAVASGSAVVALGTDTGGSVRVPAHCCGVTGWKPTAGLVPDAGALALAPTLDTIGLLARSAGDLGAAADVLVAPTPAAPPVRRAVVIEDALAAADADIAHACREAIAAIEACGVEPARRDGLPAIAAIDPHALTVMQAEAARIHRALIAGGTLDPTLRRRLAKGLDIDDATLAASRAARAPLAAAFSADILGDADVALLPVMPIRTPRAAETDPATEAFRPRTLYALSSYTRFVNMLGFPALAVPAGFDRTGLPVGLQIVGRPGHDHALIALGRALQARTDWHARVPAGIADLITDKDGIAA